MKNVRVGDKVRCVKITSGYYDINPIIGRVYKVIQFGEIFGERNPWILCDLGHGRTMGFSLKDFVKDLDLSGLEKEIEDLQTMGYRDND